LVNGEVYLVATYIREWYFRIGGMWTSSFVSITTTVRIVSCQSIRGHSESRLELQQGHSMSEQPQALSSSLKEAFEEAPDKLYDWTSGPEPRVRGDLPISVMCGLVLDCDDEPLPHLLFIEVVNLLDDSHVPVKLELISNRSYHAASRCLLQFINDRK
jgi:hypothetical protein